MLESISHTLSKRLVQSYTTDSPNPTCAQKLFILMEGLTLWLHIAFHAMIVVKLDEPDVGYTWYGNSPSYSEHLY